MGFVAFTGLAGSQSGVHVHASESENWWTLIRKRLASGVTPP